MPSHASLAKRPRLSYTPSPLSIAAQSFAAEEELARQRFLSQSKLKSSWEGIFAKYSQSFEGIADEIDQVTGEIVVDNGHVRGLAVNFRGMKNEAEWERDEIMGGGGGGGRMGGKGATKKVRLWDGMRLARKRDIGEDDTTPIAVGCEACRFQDELDDSVCLSCFPQRSTPPAVAKTTTTTTTTLTHLALDSVSAPASPATSVSKSPLRKSPRTSPASGKGVLVAGTPSSQSKDLPSDDFILEKLGSHGAAVVGFLAKARAQSVMSSPIPIFTRGDDTPGKNRTSYIRGRIEVEVSPRRAKSQSYTTAPPPPPPAMETLSPPLQNCIDQPDIRTWTPTRVTTWMLTNGILHDVDDTDLARAIEKHQVSGAVIAGSAAGRSLTLNDLKDKLEIPSFSKRMQLWSGILKLKALAPTPLRRSQRQATSPLFNSVSASSADLPAEVVDPWAPPPVQEDPFYSHIWRDEHPDGTPTKFPPRLQGPMFFKTETPDRDVAASAAKKGVKRKRGPLAGSTPELVKVEDVEGGSSVEKSGVKTTRVGTPAAKASAGRSLEQGVLKSAGARTPRTRTPAAKSPRTKTPVAKAPREGTPARTPTTKSLTAETPTGAAITKTAITKTPTPKTPAAKTPITKTPTTKNPVTVTPATKAPAAKTPTTVTPAIKTPTVKALITATPAAKTPITVTPATKTPAVKAPITATPVKKTPITKTPAKMIPMKTPAKTPAPKTPATAQRLQVGVTPGWTTNSSIQTERPLLRSILLLGGDLESDSDDELSLPASNSLVLTRKTMAVGATVKDESDNDDDDDDVDITVKKEGNSLEDAEEGGKKKTQGHNCTGGFCFVCLSLDGSEDDLI